MHTYVILHNIRSAHNVGSIFRTADGAGVSKIFLVGYTPHPVDRFGREQPEIQKTSLGAARVVPWEAYDAIEPLIAQLRAESVAIVAVEQHARAIDYRTYAPKEDVAYILGNEVDGVSWEMCDTADAIVYIPMHGTKESLNVSVAAGIVLFAGRG